MALETNQKRCELPLPFRAHQPVERIADGLMEMTRGISIFYNSRGIEFAKDPLSQRFRRASDVIEDNKITLEAKRQLVAEIFELV